MHNRCLLNCLTDQAKSESLRTLNFFHYYECLCWLDKREETCKFNTPILTISRFPNLRYMSSLQSLTSLETLRISQCENLTSFPEDGLPPSLQQLRIFYCPLLKEHCKKYQGREWSKIADIPRVEIDSRFIYDPEDENQ
jgi:hypothetical protein